MQKQIDDWTKTAQRYRSEPETGEGTEQLAEKAKHAEHERDEATAKYHHFELASAAFQIGIVLASATIITGILALAYVSGRADASPASIMTALGLWWPHLHCAACDIVASTIQSVSCRGANGASSSQAPRFGDL